MSSQSYRVLSAEDIKSFPPTTWLVQGILPDGCLGMLYGAYGLGKSFIALDLAHSIASNLRWFNRRVHAGPVVYVAAGEGVPGLRQRIRAWEVERGAEIENVAYVTEAVQLHQSSHMAKFLATIKPIQPALVVFDTLARCFVGGDENSVQDMGQAIGAADEIRATGAAVLFVHHSGRPDEEGRSHERGSSALPSAVDVMIELSGSETSDMRLLRCKKQKDAEAFPPISCQLKRVRKNGKTISLVPTL